MISLRARFLTEWLPFVEQLFGKARKPVAATASWTRIPEPLPGPELIFDAGVSVPLPRALKEGLEEVEKKWRIAKWIEGISLLVSAVLVLLLGQLFLDSFFEMPWLARVFLLGSDIYILKVLWQKISAAFLKSELSKEEVALLVEKHFEFRDGALIGAVELAQGKPGATQGSLGLLHALVDEASRKTEGLNLSDAVSMARAWQWVSASIGLLGLTIFLLVHAWPESGNLLQRAFLLNPAPYSLTEVSPVTEDLIVINGAELVLSAKALGFIPSSGHVRLTYADGREEDLPARAFAKEPGRFTVTIAGVLKPFRYQFFLHDGVGEEYGVRVEVPPTVQSLRQEKAEFGKKNEAKNFITGRIFWEEGTDLKLEATSSMPLKTATLHLEGKGGKKELSMEIEGFGRKIAKIVIPETEGGADRLFVELLGENNLKSTDPVVYMLERVINLKALRLQESSNPANFPEVNPAGMRAKDREALLKLQSEPYPEEYKPMVRQYFKNVSGENSSAGVP